MIDCSLAPRVNDGDILANETPNVGDQGQNLNSMKILEDMTESCHEGRLCFGPTYSTNTFLKLDNLRVASSHCHLQGAAALLTFALP